MKSARSHRMHERRFLRALGCIDRGDEAHVRNRIGVWVTGTPTRRTLCREHAPVSSTGESWSARWSETANACHPYSLYFLHRCDLHHFSARCLRSENGILSASDCLCPMGWGTSGDVSRYLISRETMTLKNKHRSQPDLLFDCRCGYPLPGFARFFSGVGFWICHVVVFVGMVAMLLSTWSDPTIHHTAATIGTMASLELHCCSHMRSGSHHPPVD